MHIPLGEFCNIVRELEKSNPEKALAILWYHDVAQPEIRMLPGRLARIMDDHHIGRPNSTDLAAGIRKTGLATGYKQGFCLKPGSRGLIHDWLPPGIERIQPAINHATGYLPQEIWEDTRGYIENVCKQLNGCFSAAYYDAALVMLRRLVETLIIEAYQHLSRDNEIKAADGNYFMLKELVERATGVSNHSPGLQLGRNSKKALGEIKKLGDQSAHGWRFNANAADLEKIESDVRIVVGELIQIASLKKPAS